MANAVAPVEPSVPARFRFRATVAGTGIVLAFFCLAGCAAGNSELTDSDVVYCLAGKGRDTLADAAVTLGLAGKGSSDKPISVNGHTLSLDTWRTARPRAFSRACAAIRPTRPATPTSEVWNIVADACNVVIGAAIAFGVGRWVERSTRIRQQTRQLRSATANFVTAARAYARECNNPGRLEEVSDLDVQARRAELWTELAATRSMVSHSQVTTITDILSGSLSADAIGRWRREVPGDVEQSLAEVDKLVVDLADSLEPRWRKQKTSSKAAAS